MNPFAEKPSSPPIEPEPNQGNPTIESVLKNQSKADVKEPAIADEAPKEQSSEPTNKAEGVSSNSNEGGNIKGTDITNKLSGTKFNVGDNIIIRGKDYRVYKPQEGRFVYLETLRGAKRILKVNQNILVKDDKFHTTVEKFLT